MLLKGRKAHVAWGVASAVAVVSAGCGNVDPVKELAVSSAKDAIIDGTVVSADTVGVARLSGRTGGCSASRLTDRWFLTAAHCVTNDRARPTGLSITLGTSTISAPADRIEVHPTVDVALVHLSRDLHAAENAPASNPLYLGTNRSLLAKSLDCYGYGFNTLTSGFGTLRTATLVPGSVEADGYNLPLNASNQILWRGDSGGPCILTDQGRYITGVTSYCYYQTDSAGNITRVTSCVQVGAERFRDWVNGVVGWSGSTSANGTLPNGAIPTGYINDSGNCYTCSAQDYGGAWNSHTGKLCNYNGRWSCFIGNGGVEQRHENYRVLVGDSRQVTWQPMTSASSPPSNATWGGWITDAGDCYVCRANYLGNSHGGKLCKYDNRWSCFIGNGGSEQRYETYDVMVGQPTWVSSNSSAAPSGQAVWGGWISDSGNCYPCLAATSGDTHAGKACLYGGRWSCFIGNGGVEQREESYSTLLGDQSLFQWRASTSASAPPTGAQTAGWIADSGTCYVCRAYDGDNSHLGKLCSYTGRWSCFVGNGGVEQRYESYEVLTH